VTRKIALIQGHPDPDAGRFGRALSAAYAESAREAGHEVRVIEVSRLDFPLLHRKEEWETGAAPPALADAQAAIAWADHLAIFYPLWLGDMPALLKGFLEQVLRPGFAFARSGGPTGLKLLSGKTARIVVTMGMPGFFYRWYFRAHTLKSLERNILKFCGISPVRASLVGMVEAGGAVRHEKWLRNIRMLGRKAV
jgi:putative NADPH-quinone reductase